jgi:U-box domain
MDTTPRTKKKMISEIKGTRATAEELGIIVPPEFICPITNDVMSKPLMTRQGHNFERTAIIAWLQIGNGENPITDEPLSPCDLIPNLALEEKIAYWKWDNLLPELDASHSSSSTLSLSPTHHHNSKSKGKGFDDSMSDVTSVINDRYPTDIIGIISPRKKKSKKYSYVG